VWKTCSAAYWASALSGCRDNGENPKKRVRILVMILLVYRGEDGKLACIAGALCSIAALRSSSASSNPWNPLLLHGWKYDAQGNASSGPFEARSPENLCLPAYPLQELADFCLSIWARIRTGRRFAALGCDGPERWTAATSSFCPCMIATGSRSENTGRFRAHLLSAWHMSWSITCRPWHRGVISTADRSL